jgi:4'-phosphopantetheinyl transferase
MTAARLPTAGRVDVWWIRLDQCVESADDMLDEAERSRIRGYRHANDQRRYRVMHVAQRSILAWYFETMPNALVFGHDRCHACGGDHGKPVLEWPRGLYFNISRSQDLGVIAVADSPVGIDVEWGGRRVDVETVAPDVLDPDEARTFFDTSPDDRRRLFFRRWTQKEAIVKATGAGLNTPLSEIQIDDASGVAVVESTPLRRLACRSLDVPDPRFLATLVTALPTREIRCRSWPCDRSYSSVPSQSTGQTRGSL